MKPQPRLYGRPLHVGIPNAGFKSVQDFYDWENKPLSPEVKKVLLANAASRNLITLYEPPAKPGMFASWREFRNALLKMLAALSILGFPLGFFLYKWGPALHRLLAKLGW